MSKYGYRYRYESTFLSTSTKKIISIKELDWYLNNASFYARAKTLEIMCGQREQCSNPHKIEMYKRLIDYIQLWEIIHASET